MEKIGEPIIMRKSVMPPPSPPNAPAPRPTVAFDSAPSAERVRPHAVPVVLGGFKIVEMSPPCDQDELKRIQAHFMTISQCAKRPDATEAERREIAEKINERMARFGASSTHIARRQVNALNSRFVTHDAPGPSTPYGGLRNPSGEALDERMNLFEETACEVFERVYAGDEIAPPDDIVHVSCSGYVSPSPAQTFLSKKGWLRTAVTHSYHMGCYGSFPAVRTALGLIGSSYASLPMRKRRVDLVHTEFLSLHFDLQGETPDGFVTSTLFADGFIKYSAYPLHEFPQGAERGLKILALEERILPNSLPEMTLRPGPFQFDMSLSKKVPFLIRDAIAEFVISLCGQAGVDFEGAKETMVFAIHPGGPAILTQIRNRLGIEESQMELSRKVLYEHGNMASATAPHIWKAIVDADEIPVGTKVLSMAFGPGLTVIGALFEKT